CGRPCATSLERWAKLYAPRRAYPGRATVVLLEQPLLPQKLIERFEPYLAVVDLEHALLDAERQRQKLGETIADPGSVVGCLIGREILLADAAYQQIEEVRERLELLGKLARGFGRQGDDLTGDQTVVSNAVCFYLESRLALGAQVQDTELRHVPGDDPCERSDWRECELGFDLCRVADFLASGEQAHAEGALVPEAVLGHRD